MVKRIVAALLWFYVVWAVWNEVAFATGWSIFFGPVIATAVSALVAGDPMHMIWTPRVSTDRIKGRLQALRAHD